MVSPRTVFHEFNTCSTLTMTTLYKAARTAEGTARCGVHAAQARSGARALVVGVDRRLPGVVRSRPVVRTHIAVWKEMPRGGRAADQQVSPRHVTETCAPEIFSDLRR